MSFQTAEKGSYREEHIVAFLKRWLEPLTPARREAKDIRILYMDVAKSHVAQAVTDLCWDRGYIPLFHYGCTTGVCQINDTDLHGDFERIYLEYEQAAMNSQMLLDPSNIGRTLQQVVNDVAATWKVLDHKKAAIGHKRAGLTIALDGSEDFMVTREARLFWNEGGMAAVRLEAIKEVDALVADGKLTSMADWRVLIQHPIEPGIITEEGGEFEGELEQGEALWWEDGEEEAALEADDAWEAKLDAMGSDSLSGSVGELEAGAILPADLPAEVNAASVAARRLESLKRLRAGARESKVPQAVFHLEKEISQLERGLHHSPGETSKVVVNSVLRRHVDLQLAKSLKEMSDKQAEALRQARDRRLAKSRLLRAKALKREADKAAAEVKKKLADLPKTFTPEACSAPGKKGSDMRCAALERLKLRSPKLSFEEEAKWPEIRDKWSTTLPLRYSALGAAVVGQRFVTLINRVLKAAGKHYAGPSPFSKADEKDSDPQAFLKLYREMEAQIPKPLYQAIM